MADARDTPIQTAATVLPTVALCGVLGGSDFSSFWPSEEACGDHRCQNNVERQKTPRGSICKAHNSVLKADKL